MKKRTQNRDLEVGGELVAQPATWEHTMRAVVRGEVNDVHAAAYCALCAELAGPLWTKQLGQRLAALLEARRAGTKLPTEATWWFAAMGSKVDLSSTTTVSQAMAEGIEAPQDIEAEQG